VDIFCGEIMITVADEKSYVGARQTGLLPGVEVSLNVDHERPDSANSGRSPAPRRTAA